jgi:hypothetical protein
MKSGGRTPILQTAMAATPFPTGSLVKLKECRDGLPGRALRAAGSRVLVRWGGLHYVGSHRKETLELEHQPLHRAETNHQASQNRARTLQGQGSMAENAKNQQ